MKAGMKAAAVLCLAVLIGWPMAAPAQNTHTLPLVRPAGFAGQESLVRFVNRSATSGTVRITAFDDTGRRFGPVILTLGALRDANITSSDLERGNAAKGLPVGVGNGRGSWRLDLATALTIEPLAYIRTPDGFLTSMHDEAPMAGRSHWVPFFNPGSNTSKVSHLRIINPGATAAAVTVTGRDDGGVAGSGSVRLTLAAGASRTLSAQDLERGGAGFSGRLGDGAGKWRLTVSSTVDIQVMSLLSTRTGHLSNLSTSPAYSGGGSIDNAVPVTPGETITGSLSSPSDVDYYRLPLARPGTVTFWATGEADTVLSLHDGNGNVLSAARVIAPAGGATVANNSGRRVSVTTGLDDVYARVTGRAGGRTGSYSLHNEVAPNRPPIQYKPFNPVSVKAGGVAVSVDLSEFFSDPEGGALTFEASLAGGQIGPISIGITVSGSVLSIASPANYRPGPVAIEVTASDPLGLFVVRVLKVTVQPGSNPPEPEPPGGGIDACVTASQIRATDHDTCNYAFGDGAYYRVTMTNSCSYQVAVRAEWNPATRSGSRWSGGAWSISPGGAVSDYVTCLTSQPRFRFCVHRDDVPNASPDSSSRCYGDNARWQYK